MTSLCYVESYVLNELVESGFLPFYLFCVHKLAPAPCPQVPTTLEYPHPFLTLLFSFVSSHQGLRARSVCQAQGWAEGRSVTFVLGHEPVIRCASPSVGSSPVLGSVQNTDTEHGYPITEEAVGGQKQTSAHVTSSSNVRCPQVARIMGPKACPHN